jgi:hypothetical protein
VCLLGGSSQRLGERGHLAAPVEDANGRTARLIGLVAQCRRHGSVAGLLAQLAEGLHGLGADLRSPVERPSFVVPEQIPKVGRRDEPLQVLAAGEGRYIRARQALAAAGP